MNNAIVRDTKEDAVGEIFSYLLATSLTKGHYIIHWTTRRLNRMIITLHKCPNETMHLTQWQEECFHWGRLLWMFPELRSVSTGRYKKRSLQRTHWQPILCSAESWKETVVEEEEMKENEAWWRDKELDMCSREKERAVKGTSRWTAFTRELLKKECE